MLLNRALSGLEFEHNDILASLVSIRSLYKKGYFIFYILYQCTYEWLDYRISLSLYTALELKTSGFSLSSRWEGKIKIWFGNRVTLRLYKNRVESSGSYSGSDETDMKESGRPDT